MSHVREKFCEFFKSHGHLVMQSAPLIPYDDPTLLFINAGMAPLKSYFLGYKDPPSRRIVSCQKCIRAGGKHNDLDQVGYTKRHHTFFEMCGNFSFGDYFHQEAIQFAWEFLTETLKIDSNRLWVTVHPDDKVSHKIWSNIVKPDRIIELRDNEWSMGGDGPCGMCTEIFFDHGKHIPGNIEDGDRFVEIWNIVFMTHQVNNGVKTELGKMCIDTGMGLERVEALMCGSNDNYDAPLFAGILDQLRKITSTDLCPDHKIIADHSRAVVFAISDGVLPGTSGRDYVLRKILRRALSRAANYYEADKQCSGLVKLAANYMIDKMHHAYPETDKYRGLINDTIDSEREQLADILTNGKRHIAKLTEHCVSTVPGEILFKLYDTYGIPIEISCEMIEEKKLKPDIEGFHKVFEEAKHKSEDVNKKIPLVKSHHETQFLGYSESTCSAVLLEHDSSYFIFDRTVFFAEEGGQESDHGTISGQNWSIRVTDVKKIDGTILHFGEIEFGKPQVNDSCNMSIDRQRRHRLMQHHSATHLLLAALRKYLGSSVMQKGSLVKEDGFRFDFLCNKPAEDKLELIEAQVNEWIQSNDKAEVYSMSQREAAEIGAIATFGEKYGESVRVVKIGSSIELCCGTHVGHAGDIGSFYITRERGIAAGVRRIEAVAGNAAYAYAKKHINKLNQVARTLKTSPDQVEHAIDQMKKSKPEAAVSNQEGEVLTKTMNNGLKLVAMVYDNAPQSVMLLATDKLIIDHDVVLVVNRAQNKTGLMLKSSKLDSVSLLRKLIEAFGGKGGGGRSDFAQGGLPDVVDPQQIWDALQKLCGSGC